MQTNRLEYGYRLLTKADELFLWQMLCQAAHESDVEVVMNHPDLAKYVQGWGRANDRGFIAVEQDSQQPVGAAWLRLYPSDDQGYGYIDDATPELSIAVLPEHRNYGVGTQLLNCVLEAAKSLYPAISLSVRATNPAVSLYQQFGFRIVEGSEIINRTGGRSFTMKVNLAS